ncbi:hypothetical protein PFISCL1PPCAC_25307 [Pristionchus fissidentatus]|uniref:Lipid-binding serum glycoprotein C-terminal domain-containing protein n=1 Tax=Pristionchus fissidentatus TaxID=1538716 RepID=A0AAV5WQX5_9BILA|nr:hypothetical protein PFISCL1PPCAC_25307 [Pristionchus fissidentatus]
MIRSLLFVAGALYTAVDAQSLANSFFAETGTHAGFVTRLNDKGFDLVGEYLRERALKFMQNELTFNLSAVLTENVHFSLVSNRIARFDEASFKSKFSSQNGKGFIWTGSGLNATVTAVYRVDSPAGQATGHVPLSFDNTVVELLLWTGVNADGHLKTDLVTCKVAANNVRLQFAASDAEAISPYLPHISHFITERIEQTICPSFHSELVPVISNRMLNTPLSAALFDQYFLNYGLLGPVTFGDSSLVMKHRGNAFGILRQGRTRLNDFRLPFRSPALEVPETPSGHMLDFYMSNYTMSSLLFWMDQYRKFDYEISKSAQNNSAISGYLRTDCPGDDICAGTLFPALKERFPNGLVMIKSHTVSYPRLILTPGNATVLIDTRCDAFVQVKDDDPKQGDRSRRFLTASMAVEIKLEEPKFKDYVLSAKMHIEKFTINEVASLVEGIDKSSLEFLVNALTELILQEEMASKLKGVRMPIMFDFDQRWAEVAYEQDRIRISADYCYGAKCAAPPTLAESKDAASIDYYDSVKDA